MFKKIFGDEDTSNLKFLLETLLDIKISEIKLMNQELLGSDYDDKLMIVDLIAILDDGKIVEIEVNTNSNKYIIWRNFLYMSRIMSRDLKKSERYEAGHSFIQINFDMTGSHEKEVEIYELVDTTINKKLTDKLQIIRIDVPYFINLCYNKNEFELDIKSKLISLIGSDDVSLIQKLVKGNQNMEEIYDKAKNFSDELIGVYDKAYTEEEERRMCLQDSFEQGEVKGKIEIAKNMIKENVDVELIMKVTGLSKDEIEHI